MLSEGLSPSAVRPQRLGGFEREVGVRIRRRGEQTGRAFRQASAHDYRAVQLRNGDERVTRHDTVWYSCEICGKKGKRTILYFEGADYATTVYLNGSIVGTHEGAYSRFSFDVTEHLKEGKNVLTVRCDDDNHPARIRGKQRWKITPDLSDYSVRFDFSVNAPADDVEVCFSITYEGKKIQSARMTARDCDNTLKLGLSSEELTYQVELWSVDHPALYDLEVNVYKKGKLVDTVGSYFALREYTVKGDKIILNSRPFYARLLLDQGYWTESGLTPPDEEALIKDIEICKEMGFNGVRKHQKVEDERYFYYADILGFTVWCELPSNHWKSDASAVQITEEWLEIVRANYNHPSLVTWVVFNESWGVRNILSNSAQSNLATALYYLTKSIDTMRPVISNDGWEHAVSDILTLHDYEQDGKKLYERYDVIRRSQTFNRK